MHTCTYQRIQAHAYNTLPYPRGRPRNKQSKTVRAPLFLQQQASLPHHYTWCQELGRERGEETWSFSNDHDAPHSSFMIRSLCRVSELGGAFYSETSHGRGQSTREQGGCRRWVGWRWRHLLRAI